MAEETKYLDLNSLKYFTRKLNEKKANIESPALTGTPTINGEEIATKQDLTAAGLKGEKGDTPIITAVSEEIESEGITGIHASFYADGEDLTDFTIMNGQKGNRGISVLEIETAPYANLQTTPDGKVHQMAVPQSSILAEAHVDSIYLGDILMYNGYLYKIGYIGSPQSLNGKLCDVYVDNVGNFRGPQGIQGIQGEQGPQGPKGDPGEGFFIVTDEDYAKIADYVEEKSYHSYQRPDASEPIKPNIFYDFGLQYQLEITFEAPQSVYRSNEYMFQFESPADRPTTLVLPSSVKWCYEPVIETGKTYQISVLNDLAVICGA